MELYDQAQKAQEVEAVKLIKLFCVGSLAWEELLEKFHTLTAPVFSAARRKAIIEATAQLETFRDIRDLASLLQAETPAFRQGPGRA
jgi:hypothetical protein